MKTAFCNDTVTVLHTGAGTAGAHTTTVSMMPGRYALLAGGTAGGSATTAKLRDASGNLYDLPNAAESGARAIPNAYPFEFVNPGCELVIGTTGATGPTAMVFTIGRMP